VRPRSARHPPQHSQEGPLQRNRPASASPSMTTTMNSGAQRSLSPWRPAASTKRTSELARNGAGRTLADTRRAAASADANTRRWADVQRRREADKQAQVEAAAALETILAERQAAVPRAKAGGGIEGTMYLLSILEDKDGDYEQELFKEHGHSPMTRGVKGGSEMKAAPWGGSEDSATWRLRQALHAVHIPSINAGRPHMHLHQSASGGPSLPHTAPQASARGQEASHHSRSEAGGSSRRALQQAGGGHTSQCHLHSPDADSDGIDIGDDLRGGVLPHTDSYAADLAGAVYSSHMRHAVPGVRHDAPLASRHEGAAQLRPSSAVSSREGGGSGGGQGGGTHFLRQRMRNLKRIAFERACASNGQGSDGDTDEEGRHARVPRIPGRSAAHGRQGRGAPQRIPVRAVTSSRGNARLAARKRAIASLLRPEQDIAAFVRSAGKAGRPAEAEHSARPASAAADKRPLGGRPVPPAGSSARSRPYSARQQRIKCR
jgi:hypothetical protein